MDYNAIAEKYGGTAVPANQPDVASIAAKYGGVPVNNTPPDRNLAQSALGLVFDAPAQLGNAIGQFVGKPLLEGANYLSGGALDKAVQEHTGHTLQQGMDYASTQGSTLPIIGTQLRAPNQQTPETFLGDAAQTGLTVFGLPETTAGGAGLLTDEGLSVGQKLWGAAKIGGKYGLASGAATGLEDNQDVGGVLTDAAIGGAGGAILGPTLEGGLMLGKGLVNMVDQSGIVNKILPASEARTTRMLQAVEDAKANIAKSYENAMPLTPTERVKEQNLLNKTGDNVYTTLAKYNVNVGSDQAIPQLQTISDHFANATQQAQANEPAYFNVDQIKANAYANVDKSLNSGVARAAAKNKINEEINTILSEKGNADAITTAANGQTMVNSDLVERLRRTGNDWTPFNASDPEKVGRSAGYALSNAVRDQVDTQGTFPAYREANKEWGKVIHAQEIVQKIQDSGKTFKVIGGLSGSIAQKTLSGILGFHTGGIAGTILAEMGSEYAAQILSNPALRTYFDRTLVERFGNASTATPEAVAKLTQQVEDFLDQQKALKMLPEGGKSSSPWVTPAPTTYEPAAQKINRSSSLPDSLMLPSGPQAGEPATNPGPTIVPPAPAKFISEPAAGQSNMTSINPKTGDAYVRDLKTGKMSINPQNSVESAPMTAPPIKQNNSISMDNSIPSNSQAGNTTPQTLLKGAAALGTAAGIGNVASRKLADLNSTTTKNPDQSPLIPDNVYYHKNPPVPVPAQLKSLIDQAQARNPKVPKGLIAAVLMQESHMGTNKSQYNPKIGEYAWLGGLTNIAKQDLATRGIKYDLSTEQGAINAISDYIELRRKIRDKNGTTTEITDPGKIYNRYASQVASNQDITDNIRKFTNYYSK